MKNNFLRLGFISTLVFLSACSNMQKKDDATLTQKIESQAPANTPDQIMERAALAFSSADGLTAEQKTKLHDIYKNVYIESMKIRQEIGQSKSLLFMTLAKVNYKPTEITTIKKKIVMLDQQRLNLMFNALDDVQAVVGKGVAAEKIYRHFEDFEMPRGRQRE